MIHILFAIQAYYYLSKLIIHILFSTLLIYDDEWLDSGLVKTQIEG